MGPGGIPMHVTGGGGGMHGGGDGDEGGPVKEVRTAISLMIPLREENFVRISVAFVVGPLGTLLYPSFFFLSLIPIVSRQVQRRHLCEYPTPP